MSRSIKILIVLIIAFPCAAMAVDTRFGHFEPSRFKDNRIGLKYEMEYFAASGNFLEQGNEDLPNGFDFQSYDFFLQAEYDFKNNWSAALGMTIGVAESRDAQFTRNNSAIKNIQASLSRKIKIWPRVVTIADGTLSLALEKNDPNEDKVAVGDGANWLGGGMWFGKGFPHKWILWGYLGLQIRGEGLSGLVVYSLRPRWRYRNWRLGGGFEGHISILEDDLTNDPTDRFVVTSLYNASSLRYFALNPDFHEFQLWVGRRFIPYTEVKLGVGIPLAGENSAFGDRVFINFETSLGRKNGKWQFPYQAKKRRRLKKRKKSKATLKRKNRLRRAKSKNTLQRSKTKKSKTRKSLYFR